jgi:hypothetical protein
MTIVTGRVGKSWALAGPISASAAAATANSIFFIFFIVSSTELQTLCAACADRSSRATSHG